MPRTIVYVLLLCFGLASCSDETLTKAPEPAKHTIELVAFGLSENPTKENKGFCAVYYCYLNLDTDSVFVQKRLNIDERFKTLAWAGTIDGLSQSQKLLNFIEASQQTKNGNIVSTLPNGSFFYDGYHYYSSYRKGGYNKFHYYTTHELEARFEKGVDYIMGLYQHGELKPVTKFVNADSIVVQLVNRPAFSEGRLPPPPIPKRVNYTPPSEKR